MLPAMPNVYGGQEWTALCLVRAEQRQVYWIIFILARGGNLSIQLKFAQCDSKELQGGQD